MIKMTQQMRALLASALDEDVPCMLGTASKDGRPQISPKGSIAVFDEQTLSYWERGYKSAFAALKDNPRVVVFYRNYAKAKEIPYRGGVMRFHGTARIVEDAAIRDRVWGLTNKAEQDRDPERKGVGILIDVDLIEEINGTVIMKRD
jgi:predicted pyridoxine 5'-phosphate oxidase superfamily flavin-nucleotide-binding protein